MKTKNYTDKSAMLVGTDADPVTAWPKYFAENTPEQEKENAEIRQRSMYNDKNRARIDNNQFFETRSNPLSSKGNWGFAWQRFCPNIIMNDRDIM